MRSRGSRRRRVVGLSAAAAALLLAGAGLGYVGTRLHLQLVAAQGGKPASSAAASSQSTTSSTGQAQASSSESAIATAASRDAATPAPCSYCHASGPSPSPVDGMGYNPKLKTVILAGYQSMTQWTWKWTDGGWVQAAPGPGQVSTPMVYDPAMDKTVVITGGVTGSPFQAMMWDGTQWSPIASPPGTGPILLVYEAARSRLLALTAEATWAFDGTTWTQVGSAGPKHLAHASMAYDPSTRNVLFFGSSCDDFFCQSSETWSWDGIAWTQLHPSTAPPGPSDAQLAADAAGFNATGQHLVMIDDRQVIQYKPDFDFTMWEWTGADWSQLHPQTIPRYGDYMRLAVDSDQHRIVLFQAIFQPNHAPVPETWIYAGGNWRRAD